MLRHFHDGRRGSGRSRGVSRFDGITRFLLGGSGSVMNRLLSRDVRCFSTADGRRTDFRMLEGRGDDNGRGGNWRSRGCGRAFPATRSRGSRSSGFRLTGALFTLPPGSDPRHLIIGQPTLWAQHRHIHRAQHGDDFVHVDLEFASHIHDAQLAQTQPPKVTPSARCRARWPERPAPTLRR